MGKIVKYCAGCEESFAEKFAFCPNCGQAMTAFEMNPINAATKIAGYSVMNRADADKITEDILDIPAPAPSKLEALPVSEESPVMEVPAAVEAKEIEAQELSDEYQTPASINEVELSDNSVIEETEPEVVEDFAPETKTFAAAAGASNSLDNDPYKTTNFDYQPAQTTRRNSVDDGYRITVIEEKNVNQRNGLLLGSLVLIISLVLASTVYSLFNKDFGVGAIGDENLFAFVPVVDDVPMEIEKQPKPKDDKQGGGGGGGGKENPQEATKGRLPNQVEKPIMPPQPLPQVTNASLPNPNETQGRNKREKTNEPVGLTNGLTADTLSSGSGSGGGIGNGRGTGAGGGLGTGEGNGIGSGSGNGNGNGDGDGTGNGSRNGPPPPPKVVAGVTTDVKIISKPSAKYTDAARQNQFSGTVRLRVTFGASGQIINVAPVGNLPYGLTEQAIAAARAIRFEPAKVNGVAVTKIKQIDYAFTLY